MGSMMKELLVIITIAIAMVCGGLHIPIDEVNQHEDTILRECATEINGHQRPLIDPGLCDNSFMDPVCAYLYPVSEAELQEDSDDDDYYVSSRCYQGPLQGPASACASKCANCCETPKFNCPNKRPLLDCVLIAKLGLCQAPGMEDFVSFFCSGQCGHCQQEPFNKLRCEDESPNCKQLFGIVPCTVPYMHKNCKETCFTINDEKCLRVLAPLIDDRFAPRPGGSGPVPDGFLLPLGSFDLPLSGSGPHPGGRPFPYPSSGRLDSDPIDADQ